MNMGPFEHRFKGMLIANANFQLTTFNTLNISQRKTIPVMGTFSGEYCKLLATVDTTTGEGIYTASKPEDNPKPVKVT